MALYRFLSTPEAESYEVFSQLLRDVRVLRRPHGISERHLMRQLIARSPSGLKSLLLQATQAGVTWVVFPERLVDNIRRGSNPRQKKLPELRGIPRVSRKPKTEEAYSAQRTANVRITQRNAALSSY
ncbi:hypothetical protein PAEPH01_2020 [Pancytospora epiphaga]|nr:hypothetical protein PAEPH01_2020 [Pancytospora epiphaga]